MFFIRRWRNSYWRKKSKMSRAWKLYLTFTAVTESRTPRSIAKLWYAKLTTARDRSRHSSRWPNKLETNKLAERINWNCLRFCVIKIKTVYNIESEYWRTWNYKLENSRKYRVFNHCSDMAYGYLFLHSAALTCFRCAWRVFDVQYAPLLWNMGGV